MKKLFTTRLARRHLALAAAILFSSASSSALAATPSCSSCVLLNPASPDATAASNLGINVAAVMRAGGWGAQAPSAAQFTSIQGLSGPVANWDGMGDLPGAFQRPWELAPNTTFDPSFRTSYYSSETGPINTHWAPWNWPQRLMELGSVEAPQTIWL